MRGHEPSALLIIIVLRMLIPRFLQEYATTFLDNELLIHRSQPLALEPCLLGWILYPKLLFLNKR